MVANSSCKRRGLVIVPLRPRLALAGLLGRRRLLLWPSPRVMVPAVATGATADRWSLPSAGQTDTKHIDSPLIPYGCFLAYCSTETAYCVSANSKVRSVGMDILERA